MRVLLHHSPAPTCWDTRIPDGQLATRYDAIPDPAAPYYTLSCLHGLQVGASLAAQPGLRLSQQVVEIDAHAKPCTPPFTADQMNGVDTSCVMQLDANQRRVTQFLANRAAQIPDTVITLYPNTRPRTQTNVAFADVAACSGCTGSNTRTPNRAAGGVTMFAQMTSFQVQPGQPGGPATKTCNGTEQLAPDGSDTPATTPGACWFRYTHSSGNQPGHVYQAHAIATWQVRIAGERAPFATFRKDAEVNVPVYDVQTLVIGQR